MDGHVGCSAIAEDSREISPSRPDAGVNDYRSYLVPVKSLAE